VSYWPDDGFLLSQNILC